MQQYIYRENTLQYIFYRHLQLNIVLPICIHTAAILPPHQPYLVLQITANFKVFGVNLDLFTSQKTSPSRFRKMALQYCWRRCKQIK